MSNYNNVEFKTNGLTVIAPRPAEQTKAGRSAFLCSRELKSICTY